MFLQVAGWFSYSLVGYKNSWGKILSMAREKESVKNLYFEIQADFGFTKHMGGQAATDELAKLCRIRKGSRVLEIGCGVGFTSCYLAEKYGCRVTGVDISPMMVKRSKERAKRKKLEGLTEFLVADAAKKLPFKSNLFDVVIAESVIAFLKNKQNAVNECARVTKKGGFVGFNESTWLKEPSPEISEYMTKTVGTEELLGFDVWKGFLRKAGLRIVEARLEKVRFANEVYQQVKRVKPLEYLGILLRLCKGMLTDSRYQEFARRGLATFWERKRASKFLKDVGYGVYVAKKK